MRTSCSLRGPRSAPTRRRRLAAKPTAIWRRFVPRCPPTRTRGRARRRSSVWFAIGAACRSSGSSDPMIAPGATLPLVVEKPAVGGRMIARVDGQIVLVAGAIPGERVQARIERVGKGVADADTMSVDEPSPDRRPPFTDLACGGSLYAHIAYPRQLTIKA